MTTTPPRPPKQHVASASADNGNLQVKTKAAKQQPS